MDNDGKSTLFSKSQSICQLRNVIYFYQSDDDEDCYQHDCRDGDDVNEDDEEHYIEEEHQFTLNELYAQAHKQMLANGSGSTEDLRAWQAIYPRLIGGGGGITP